MKFEPRQPRAGINTPSPDQHVREAALLIVAATVLVVGAIWLVSALADGVVQWVTPEVETQVFGPLLEGMIDNIGPRDDAPASAALSLIFQPISQIVARTSDLAGYDFQIHVVCQKQPNALALPGGGIVVTSGLLQRLKTENELVFVLGHELGHFANRDHLRGLGRSLVWALVLGLAGAGEAAIELATSAAMASHNRGQELAADRVGLTALQAQYGHIGGAAALLRVLAEATGETSIMRLNLLRSHPISVDRIDKLRAWQAEQGWSTQPERRPLAAVLRSACQE